MHRVASQIEAAISIPLLHIAEATAERIAASHLSRVGLLGTRFTMDQDFYRGRLARHGLEILLPSEEDRRSVHRIIYDELCRGKILESSRSEYARIVADLVNRGAEAVVLGCTEIGLLLRASDCAVPLFDTTQIHAEEAARHALAEDSVEISKARSR